MEMNQIQDLGGLAPAEGIAALRSASRIAVIGPCGAGKSTLARQLGAMTGLPVTHLDRIYWKAGWIESSTEEFRAAQANVVADERWVIDGNYGGTFDLRMPRAELVIWLDFPRRIYFPRVLLRVLKNYGRVRPDLAPGCPEKFDFDFLRFVWRIPKDSRPRTIERLIEFNVPPKLLRLTSPREVKEMRIENLECRIEN